jgi:hypothetical protein
MTRIFLILSIAFCFSFISNEFETPYEKSGKTHSATHEQAIDYYERLDDTYEQIKLLEYGKTDVGRPLHLVVLSKDKVFDPEEIRQSGKRVLFINNAIHPGESCGVDACMMLARDLMEQSDMQNLLDHAVLCIVPIYNIGGSLNRGCCTRANQVGPAEQGFRGNAKNLDLNRDFVKCDSKNALSLSRIFTTWQPDVFIDTHTTNGADYPAHLTYIPSLPSKAPAQLNGYMQASLIPAIKKHMAQAEVPISPYVYSMGRTPDKGIMGFIDHPRYSSGYANLFHTMSFITEAHMLKSFEQRVNATYEFILGTLTHVNKEHEEIGRVITQSREAVKEQDEYVLTWELDKSRKGSLMFSGYEAKYKKSEVTGQDRWYYDRNAPYTKEIDYFEHYKPTFTVKKPEVYIIPQAYDGVIKRMKANGVEMEELRQDMTIEVEVSYITSFKNRTRPYEGHFYYDEVTTRREVMSMKYYKGDKIVVTNQVKNDYIVHVLEPESHDSFFRWGFFDGILMQKEYFSPYLFEDEAARMLKEDEKLKEEFEAKKAEDEAFAKNWWAQLSFIYQRSPYYEKSHNRYPVGRFSGSMSTLGL